MYSLKYEMKTRKMRKIDPNMRKKEEEKKNKGNVKTISAEKDIQV